MFPLKTIFNKNLKYASISKKRIVIQMPPMHRANLFINKWYTITNGNKMVDKCFICRQRTELQPGFYQGTGDVSYGLNVGISNIIFVDWISATGHGFKNREVLWWFPLNILLL